MSGPVTIDLGLARAEPEVDRPWAVWSALRQVEARRWLAAALTVLVTLPLAGAGAPGPVRLVPLWTFQAGVATGEPILPASGGRHLYLTSHTGSGGTLTAYRLADGGIDWEASLPREVAGGAVAVRVESDVVLAFRYSPVGFTVAYDRTTGQMRWWHDGAPYGGPGGGVVVLEREARAADAAEQWRWWPPRELTVVDLDSGRVGQVLRVDGDALATLDRDAAGRPHLVTLHREGLLRRHAPATGEVLATAMLAPFSSPPTLSVSDGVVLVGRSGLPATEAAAYDRDTLTLRWSVPGELWPDECGPVLCVHVIDGGESQLWAIDPATGVEVWSRHCLQDRAAGSCWLWLAAAAHGRLWLRHEMMRWDAVTGEPIPDPRLWVVDAGTGRELWQRGAWQVWPRAGEPARTVLIAELPETTDEESPRPVLVAHVGPDLAVDVLGQFEARGWVTNGEHLLAWTVGDTVQIWQIR